MAQYDLVIIGGGPAGYTGAIRAAQLGMKVAVVEKDTAMGGTCLRIGCIPSKAMLDSSELYHKVAHEGAEYGVVAKPQLDLATMLKRKDSVVSALTSGIAGLLKKNKIDRYVGTGSFVSPNRVKVVGAETLELETHRVMIATGSAPVELKTAPFDGKVIVDSTGALCFDAVPENLLVVGGGAIGLEMGSVWSRLGSKVTIVEFLDRIVPFADLEAGKALTRSLKKQGLDFKLSTKVTGVKVGKDGKATVSLEDSKGAASTLVVDRVLVAIGRKPYTDGLGLTNIGLATDERGRIAVGHHFETAVKGVYAVGDVVPGPMLAHKAEEDAVCCVERMAGVAGHVNYDLVPSVVYTWPELAQVGQTEEQLVAKNIPFAKGTFPFLANGRAKAAGDTDGLVKILAHKDTDEILGVHMVWPRTSDMIAQAVLAMEFRASAEDWARTCHAHPTFAEAGKQAALDVLGRVIER